MTGGAGPSSDQLEPHCEFCEGAQACRNGVPVDANPYRAPEIREGHAVDYGHPHLLWRLGHATESSDAVGQDVGTGEIALMVAKSDDAARAGATAAKADKPCADEGEA